MGPTTTELQDGTRGGCKHPQLRSYPPQVSPSPCLSLTVCCVGISVLGAVWASVGWLLAPAMLMTACLVQRVCCALLLTGVGVAT